MTRAEGQRVAEGGSSGAEQPTWTRYRFDLATVRVTEYRGNGDGWPAIRRCGDEPNETIEAVHLSAVVKAQSLDDACVMLTHRLSGGQAGDLELRWMHRGKLREAIKADGLDVPAYLEPDLTAATSQGKT